MNKAFLVLILCLCTLELHAQTVRYVVDDLSIPVRTGTSRQHKILRFVESGTALTVLETAEEAGYTRVRTPQGTEGWVRSEQLMDGPGARARLAQAKQRIEQLKLTGQAQADEIAALKQALGEAQGRGEALQGELEQQAEVLARLERVAAEPIKISEENEGLKQALAEARDSIKGLSEENAGLRDTSLKQWFLIGAGVAIGSLLLGLVIPRIPWRRRRWDDFH